MCQGDAVLDQLREDKVTAESQVCVFPLYINTNHRPGWVEGSCHSYLQRKDASVRWLIDFSGLPKN